MSPRLVLSVPEAAETLGVSRWTVYRLIEKGQIPSVRLGRRVGVPVAGLQHWLDQGAADSLAHPEERAG